MIKTSKLLVVSMLAAFLFLAYSPTKAGTKQNAQHSNGILSGLGDWLHNSFGRSINGNTGNTNTEDNGSTGTIFPIKNETLFLIIIGVITGFKVFVVDNEIETHQGRL
jgi:hypothetical protein